MKSSFLSLIFILLDRANKRRLLSQEGMEVEEKPLGQTIIETGNSAQDSNKEYFLLK